MDHKSINFGIIEMSGHPKDNDNTSGTVLDLDAQYDADQPTLRVEREEERRNVFINSQLLSRATVFYPDNKLTPWMRNKLVEIAKSGGTDIDNPLGSVLIKSYGRTYLIELFVDFMLQPHRDLLDTLLASGDKMTLGEKSYRAGARLRWKHIFEQVPGVQPMRGSNLIADTIDDRSCIVISMSMYNLARKMGYTPHRNVYDNIEKRLHQLYSAFVTASELDDNGNPIGRAPIRFIKDYRFCYCPAYDKNGKGSKRDRPSVNHVFVIIDRSLLLSIREHGYWLREDQAYVKEYSNPRPRNFLKYIKTHENDFINSKKLKSVLDYYIASFPVPVYRTFKNKVLADITSPDFIRQIWQDFGIQIMQNEDHEWIIRVDPAEASGKTYKLDQK